LNLSGNGLTGRAEDAPDALEEQLASRLERNANLPDDHVTIAWLVRTSALPHLRLACDAMTETGLRDLLFQPLLPRRKQ
jgi:hypothetical protein